MRLQVMCQVNIQGNKFGGIKIHNSSLITYLPVLHKGKRCICRYRNLPQEFGKNRILLCKTGVE